MKAAILLLSLTLFSQPECERAKNPPPCYGECGNFVDKNNNSICDIWERYNTSKKEKKKEPHQTIISQITNQTPTKPKENKLFKHGFIYILLVNIVAILLTELFAKDKAKIKILWNWLLFFSMLLSSMSGFTLYFSLLKEHKKLLYSLHIQSSVVFFITASYHTIKRFNCMLKWSKTI